MKPWQYYVLGGVVLAITVSIALLGVKEATGFGWLMLGAGIVYGSLLFRFELPYKWMTVVALMLPVVGFIVVGSLTAVMLIFGFVAGSNFGAGWRLQAK